MIAVSTVDLVGGIILAATAAIWLIVDGFQDFARGRCSRPSGEAGLPDDPVAGHRVEAGTFATADPTYREEVAGIGTRHTSAVATIETLTFPGPYNRGAVKK